MNSTQLDSQILSIACDNASKNDCMVSELENLLEDFPGNLNCIRCFLHVLSLIAKTTLKQFNIPHKKTGDTINELDWELQDLADRLELEEMQTRSERNDKDGKDDEEVDEGLVKELCQMADVDMEAELCLIQLLLVKVNY